MAGVAKKDGRDVIARLTTIDQKLQRVVTREELDERLARFVTRDELDERLARFVTRDHLDERLARYATREESIEMHVETRRHFDVVAEGLRGDIRLIAEGQGALVSRMDAMQQDITIIKGHVQNHALRLSRLETHIAPLPGSTPRAARARSRKPGR